MTRRFRCLRLDLCLGKREACMRGVQCERLPRHKGLRFERRRLTFYVRLTTDRHLSYVLWKSREKERRKFFLSVFCRDAALSFFSDQTSSDRREKNTLSEPAGIEPTTIRPRGVGPPTQLLSYPTTPLHAHACMHAYIQMHSTWTHVHV